LIELRDGRLGDGAVLEFDEGESARPARFAVNRDDDLGRLADAREMRAQVYLGGSIGHIADEQTYSQDYPRENRPGKSS